VSRRRIVVASGLGICLALASSGAFTDFASGLAAFREKAYGDAHDRWQECARQGSADCQYGLGVIYDEGLGVAADIYQALVWYEQAARQDHPDALMQLGFLYATGRDGIVQDPVQAWAWFARAASLGVPGAAEGRNRVAKVLTSEERARAERLADEASIRYHLQK